MPGHRKRPYLDEDCARLSIREIISDGLLDGKHGYQYLKVTTPGVGTQTIALTPLPRMVPGRAVGTVWYFICGETGRRASVLYRPAGQHRFASHAHWRKQHLAHYRSEGVGAYNRAFQASEKITSRLAVDDNYTLRKPAWMRWATFDRLIARRAKYERILDAKLFRKVAKL
jgi:hypothetical protein